MGIRSSASNNNQIEAPPPSAPQEQNPGSNDSVLQRRSQVVQIITCKVNLQKNSMLMVSFHLNDSTDV